MLFGGAPPLEAGERRVITVHPHPWPLVRAGLPMVLLVLLPVPYTALDVALPALRLATHFALFLWLLGVAMACYLARWLVYGVLPWTQRVYVLTNRRLIAQSGVLAVHRRECSLLKIEESDYVVRGPAARLFDVGDVEVQTSGGLGTIVLQAVAQPRRVESLISAQCRARREEIASNRLSEVPGEVVRQVTAVVRGTPPEHSALTEQLRPVSARAARAQARLSLLPNEAVVDVLRSHAIVLAIGLLAPLIGVLLVVAAATMIGPAFMPVAVGLVVLGLAPWAIWRLLTYLNHQYVLTTDRLMELKRTPLVYQMRDVVQLSAIQDVSLEIPSLFGRLADIGDVVVEVAGPAHHLVLKTVARPAQLQKLIFEAIDMHQHRKREQEDKHLIATLTRWFQEYHRLQQGGDPR